MTTTNISQLPTAALPSGPGDPAPSVTVEPEGSTRVVVRHLDVDDAVLADLVAGRSDDERVQVAARALAVGARGLLTMGLGVNLEALDGRVRRTFEDIAAEALAQSREAVDAGRRAFAEHFDPGQRTSLIGQALGDFTVARDRLLDGLNPQLADSHTAQFLATLTELIGPQGRLDETLRQALDPDADGSGLARLAESVDARFFELRDLISRDQGRQEESSRGTAKGVAFEDRVEDRLRTIAAGLGGAIVERTSREPGHLGAESFVGDLVLTLASGTRIAVEVKNAARLGLAGKGGVLAELDRTVANRSADFALCVSAQDAFPQEVGSFGVYGNRVLVVDDGDGVMLAVAVQWLVASAAAAGSAVQGVDTVALCDRLERIRAMAQRFSGAKRALAEVQRSIESVRSTMDELRSDLLDDVAEARRLVEG